ncbi:hypothetical protein [Niabella hibiscisoli]|nr:hypothetical protein [Niabella hibiscisoli]
MLFFADFYKPLGDGKCIGDAMVSWWQARGNGMNYGSVNGFMV